MDAQSQEKRGGARQLVAIALIAFALHFAWESAQCTIFFVHGSYDATWSGMLKATAGDVLITWIVYACVALVSRDAWWYLGSWTRRHVLTMAVAALLIGVVFEWHALEAQRWSYSEWAPVVPGLGVSFVPLLQLLLLTPLTLRLAKAWPGPERRSETEVIRARYNRVAPIYDALDWVMELRFRGWRRRLWSGVEPGQVLEIGVGTGKNMPFYPEHCEIVAMDISEGMLERAKRRALKLGSEARLELGDAQALPYDDDSFDAVVATFVFCSIPDPGRALEEALRVLKPGGRLYLLEHVLSGWPVLRPLMRWLDFIPVRIWGAHINRETYALLEASGFQNATAIRLSLDIVLLMSAFAPSSQAEELDVS